MQENIGKQIVSSIKKCGRGSIFLMKQYHYIVDFLDGMAPISPSIFARLWTQQHEIHPGLCLDDQQEGA